MTKDYYTKKLAANLLHRCYEIASPRIQQYLEAEIQFVLNHLNPSDRVLELGCGYGRVLSSLAVAASEVFGLDTSYDSLDFATTFLHRQHLTNFHLLQMNAQSLDFKEDFFDVVIAIQNAISAFKIPPTLLLSQCLSVTKPGGVILLSSYSANIWDARLEWFLQQAGEGLLGEIDLERTGDGVIVGKDGFRATTFSPSDFRALASQLDVDALIKEVDNSSVFCVITKN
ncbi:MAG: class I SAM-dependent methyltransferase [Promethearchaeota archaeon]|nr:MAG: class I SAM-dependent methyltransferase [Candidatus Lokiarchaeota archaeon]